MEFHVKIPIIDHSSLKPAKIIWQIYYKGRHSLYKHKLTCQLVTYINTINFEYVC